MAKPSRITSGVLALMFALLTTSCAVPAPKESDLQSTAQPASNASAETSDLQDTAQQPVNTKTLYYNGTIYTNDKSNPSAEAVVVDEGKFAFVGSYEKALDFAGDGCSKVDLQGQFVMPGFFDAHIHPAGTAIKGTFDFGDYFDDANPKVEQYTDALKDYLEKNPDVKYIKGAGWNNSSFAGGSPTKEILDAVNSEIPIALRSLDGHSLWTNSKAIELAGITPETQVPGGEGIIELNDKGEVSGTFRELTAIDLVINKFPPVSVEEYKAAILKSQAYFSSIGITGMFEPMVATDGNLYRAYRELADNNELNMHVALAFTINPQSYATEFDWILNELAKYKDVPDQKLRISACKFFADGVTEGGTAYLEQPYTDDPHSHGVPIWQKDEMAKAFQICDENGLTIHVHAVGDAAISMTLDCMEGLSTDHRNAICHIQLVDEKDYVRFRDMGVVAVVPPLWAFITGDYVDSEFKHLGMERVDNTYPIKTFIDNGVVTAAHSDYPVFAMCNPLVGIEVAVTREPPVAYKAEVGEDVPPLNRKEAITIEQSIDIYTYQAAYASFMEDITGSITVGKSADFVVIDKNILTIPGSLASVMVTYFQGEKVFSK